MKTKLLIFLLMVTAFVSAQATFTNIAVSSIGHSSATLSCNVSPNGDPITNGYFALSESLADLQEGRSILARFSNINQNSGSHPRSAVATGLKPATLYFYRVVAAGRWYTGVSAHGTFTTKVSPLTAVSVGSIDNTSATVQYTLNGTDLYSSISIGFETAKTAYSENGFSTGGNTTLTRSQRISNLIPGTTYYIKVEARGNAIGTYTSDELSFTTTGTRTGPVVSMPTATAITGNSATLKYSVFSENLSHTSVLKYGISASELNLKTKIDTVNIGSVTHERTVILKDLEPSTSYYFQAEATNNDGTTKSAVGTFVTAVVTKPTLTVLGTLKNFNSTKISYQITANNGNSRSKIKYGLASSNLSSEIVGFEVESNINFGRGSANLPNLLPNTVYYYQVEASNSAGTTVAEVGTFTTTELTKLYDFKFNNNYNNSTALGNNPFSSSANTSFVNGRNDSVRSALSLAPNVAGSTATLARTPSSNSPRTISLWYKNTTTTAGIAQAPIFYCGSTSHLRGFGFYVGSNGNPIFQPGATEKNMGGSFATTNTWHHAAITFDGETVKFYMNGDFLGQESYTPNYLNTEGSVFKLGGSNAHTSIIDDLKIYDGALNDADVLSLFTNDSTLSKANEASTLMAEFKFNNSRTSEKGGLTFQTASTSFVNDKNGSLNGAIAVVNSSSSVVIPNLPAGAAERSIAVWVKLKSLNADDHNQFFSYGSAGVGRSFGGSMNATKARVIGWGSSAEFNTINALNTWYHFVFIYDGTKAHIYKNGVLIGSQTIAYNTLMSDNLFYIGRGVGGELNFNGEIDELKIYSSAITATHALALYNDGVTTSLSRTIKNTANINLYPNPVRDILNVETALSIKSVEIYNLQGQKVLTSNQKQVNVAGLAAGVYVVKVQDMENKVATHKISVK